MGGDLALEEGRLTPGWGEDLQVLLLYAFHERERCLDMPDPPLEWEVKLDQSCSLEIFYSTRSKNQD